MNPYKSIKGKKIDINSKQWEKTDIYTVFVIKISELAYPFHIILSNSYHKQQDIPENNVRNSFGCLLMFRTGDLTTFQFIVFDFRKSSSVTGLSFNIPSTFHRNQEKGLREGGKEGSELLPLKYLFPPSPSAVDFRQHLAYLILSRVYLNGVCVCVCVSVCVCVCVCVWEREGKEKEAGKKLNKGKILWNIKRRKEGNDGGKEEKRKKPRAKQLPSLFQTLNVLGWDLWAL